jgi:hypothetical protein
MAAGLSKRQIYRRVYSRLKQLQWELARAGVYSVYRKQQLASDEDKNPSGLQFNVSFRILSASNGEVAGLPVVTIWENRVVPQKEIYGEIMGTFDAGIRRLKEVAAQLRRMEGREVHRLRWFKRKAEEFTCPSSDDVFPREKFIGYDPWDHI